MPGRAKAVLQEAELQALIAEWIADPQRNGFAPIINPTKEGGEDDFLRQAKSIWADERMKRLKVPYTLL
jgi:hypothetical protein